MDLELEATKGENEEYASLVQEFIATVFAPELMTRQGRVIIIVVWIILTICMGYGASQIEVNFNMDFFMAGTPQELYKELDLRHFETGFGVYVIIDNAD